MLYFFVSCSVLLMMAVGVQGAFLRMEIYNKRVSIKVSWASLAFVKLLMVVAHTIASGPPYAPAFFGFFNLCVFVVIAEFAPDYSDYTL